MKTPRRYLLLLAGILLIMLGGPAAPARAQQDAPGEIVVLEATGVVLPAFGGYISRGLDEADVRNAEVVIIMLDTLGGSAATTLEIVEDIRTSDVPVIVYVGPPGASAASAGLLITLAGHGAAMAPDTAIGATSPVGQTGEDLDSTSERKAMEFVSAQARSLAERRGEAAVELANAAVFDAKAVTPSEALDAHLIDFVVEDLDALLQVLDGFEVEVNGRPRTIHTEGASRVLIPMNVLESILLLLTHPNIVSMLVMVGSILIVVEIRTPGGWVAGTIGVICLGLGMYGLGVLPVNWLGIVFVGLAMALFILEIKAPVHGVLTGVGAFSLAVGLIVLFSQPEMTPFGRLSIPLVIGQSVVLGAMFFGIGYMALRAQKRTPTTGYPALIGQVGRATQDIAPRGMVQVFGERWRAESVDGTAIPEGSDIEVVDAGGMWVRVRRR